MVFPPLPSTSFSSRLRNANRIKQIKIFSHHPLKKNILRLIHNSLFPNELHSLKPNPLKEKTDFSKKLIIPIDFIDFLRHPV